MFYCSIVICTPREKRYFNAFEFYNQIMLRYPSKYWARDEWTFRKCLAIEWKQQTYRVHSTFSLSSGSGSEFVFHRRSICVTHRIFTHIFWLLQNVSCVHNNFAQSCIHPHRRKFNSINMFFFLLSSTWLERPALKRKMGRKPTHFMESIWCVNFSRPYRWMNKVKWIEWWTSIC